MGRNILQNVKTTQSTSELVERFCVFSNIQKAVARVFFSLKRFDVIVEPGVVNACG